MAIAAAPSAAAAAAAAAAATPSASAAAHLEGQHVQPVAAWHVSPAVQLHQVLKVAHLAAAAAAGHRGSTTGTAHISTAPPLTSWLDSYAVTNRGQTQPGSIALHCIALQAWR
jgi:hypothetical protein